jgi:HAE1 family hydrophobic/amphiphilic exporter-1
MTSFAFVLGCVPLVIASGAGARSRRILGTVVVFGMLAATLIANFITPALFVAFQKLTDAVRQKRREREQHRGGPPSHPVTGGGAVTRGEGGSVK